MESMDVDIPSTSSGVRETDARKLTASRTVTAEKASAAVNAAWSALGVEDGGAIFEKFKKILDPDHDPDITDTRFVVTVTRNYRESMDVNISSTSSGVRTARTVTADRKVTSNIKVTAEEASAAVNAAWSALASKDSGAILKQFIKEILDPDHDPDITDTIFVVTVTRNNMLASGSKDRGAIFKKITDITDTATKVVEKLSFEEAMINLFLQAKETIPKVKLLENTSSLHKSIVFVSCNTNIEIVGSGFPQAFQQMKASFSDIGLNTDFEKAFFAVAKLEYSERESHLDGTSGPPRCDIEKESRTFALFLSVKATIQRALEGKRTKTTKAASKEAMTEDDRHFVRYIMSLPISKDRGLRTLGVLTFIVVYLAAEAEWVETASRISAEEGTTSDDEDELVSDNGEPPGKNARIMMDEIEMH